MELRNTENFSEMVNLDLLKEFWNEAKKKDISEASIVTGADAPSIELSNVENEEQTVTGTKITVNLPDYSAASDTVYNNSTETLISVGGIPAGSTFENKTIKQMLDLLLYPYVAPVVSCSSSPKNGGTYEYGNTQTITSVTVNVTKKARDITKVEIFNGAESLGSKTEGVEAGGTFVFDVNVPINGTEVQIKATVTDSDGKTVNATAGKFSWVYPFFYGVSDKAAAEFTSEDVLVLKKDVSAKGSKSYTYTTTNNKAVIAYPKTYGTLKKVTDSSGVTDYTNSFGIPSTISVTSAEPSWGPVDYYVYTSGNATVTGFQYKFSL